LCSNQEIHRVDWQTVSAIIIVIVAAAWLARRIWRTLTSGLRGNRAVGSCGNCSKNPAAADKSVVTLGQLRRK
jgi:hypothetical protein